MAANISLWRRPSILGAGVAAQAQDQTKAAAPAQSGAAQPAAQPAAPAARPVSAAMHGKMEAKFVYCKTCHGVQGQGFRGAFPIPRLAGQQPEYIKNQLQAFIEKRRENVVMNHVAQALSPEMVEFLANSFHGLKPPPLGGAPGSLAPAGKDIFHKGVQAANVPPAPPAMATTPWATTRSRDWRAS